MEDVEVMDEPHNDNVIKELSEELQSFFTGDLIPVAPKAQKKVPVPEG